MTDIQIPRAMVEAAARRWWEILTVDPRTPWEERDERDRQHDRDQVTLILVAALGVCEVREEDGMRQANTERPELGGELWDGNHYKGWVRDVVAKEWDEIPPDELAPWSWQLVRRLVITTPAEQVDTEGAKT